VALVCQFNFSFFFCLIFDLQFETQSNAKEQSEVANKNSQQTDKSEKMIINYKVNLENPKANKKNVM